MPYLSSASLAHKVHMLFETQEKLDRRMEPVIKVTMISQLIWAACQLMKHEGSAAGSVLLLR